MTNCQISPIRQHNVLMWFSEEETNPIFLIVLSKQQSFYYENYYYYLTDISKKYCKKIQELFVILYSVIQFKILHHFVQIDQIRLKGD